MREKPPRVVLDTNLIVSGVTSLREATERVTPLDSLPLHSRDPKDDKLLALALGGNADYLITGDQDLLVLNDNPGLENLRIITAAVFLQEQQQR
jgi:predicted nucleic acid-binding protein